MRVRHGVIGVLVGVAAAAAPSAALAATASVRAFGAAPAVNPFTLLVDGKAAARLVTRGTASKRFSLRAGRHAFRVVVPEKRRSRTLARLVARVSAGEHDTVALTGRRKLRIVLVREGAAVPAMVSWRIANLSPTSGPVDVKLGDAGLLVVSRLSFGHTSTTVPVSPDATPTGAINLRASHGGKAIGLQVLPLAPGTNLTYAIVDTKAGTRLVLLPLPSGRAPTASSPATITPTTPSLGAVVTCNPPVFTGGATLAYLWLRDGVPITGAAAQRYTLTAADVLHDIGCRVTARNAGGVVWARATAIRLPGPAANTTVPAITGPAPAGGVTLTCDPGVWTGSPTFTFVWLRDGAPIAGATAQTYVLQAADSLHAVTCSVTATTRGGSASAASTNSITLGAAPTLIRDHLPTITPTAPSLTAGPHDNRITCNSRPARDWNGLPTLTFQWLRDGVAIPGQTTPTYDLTVADVAHTVTCTVTATASGLSTTVSSNNAIALPSPPVAKSVVISDPAGPYAVGHVVTCASTWTNAVADIAYVWLRDGHPIAGETGPRYTLSAADAGHVVRCQAMARNAGGFSAWTLSAPASSVTLPGAPVNTARPTVSGNSTKPFLTCNPGTWTPGSPAPIFTYTWWRDDNTQLQPNPNPFRYTPQVGDDGHAISCRVVAANAGGASAPVPSSNAIQLAPLRVTITSAPADPSPSSDAAFSWTPNDPRAAGYTCTLDSSPAAACSSGQTFTGLGNGPHTFTVTPFAGTAIAAASSYSWTVQLPAPPANTSAPQISGDASAIVLSSVGGWNPPGDTFAVYWVSVSPGAPGVVVGGCTGTAAELDGVCSFAPDPVRDAGATIYAVVVATNGAGSSPGAVSNGVTLP